MGLYIEKLKQQKVSHVFRTIINLIKYYMAKKRNRRTRKKYKKRGGFTDEELQACNDRLESQGVKKSFQRLMMCNENVDASLDT